MIYRDEFARVGGDAVPGVADKEKGKEMKKGQAASMGSGLEDRLGRVSAGGPRTA